MNKEFQRNLIVILTLLGVVAFIFLSIESKGRFVESRVGFIGLVCIAAMFFLAVYVTPKKPTDQSKSNDENQ